MQNLFANVLNSLLVLVVVESMVFAFFDRRVLSVSIVLVTAWQVRHHRGSGGGGSLNNLGLRVAYGAFSLGLAAFTFQVGQSFRCSRRKIVMGLG